MSKDQLVRRSKHLSLVLRHNPGSVGLVLDEAGWTDVDKLLPAMKMTREQLDEVVRDNSKKRFEFSEDGTKIRASQGHSVDVDLGYEEKEPPSLLFHGTSNDIIVTLRADGLQKMKRHHVHLSSDEDTAMSVARRRPRPVVLDVRAGDMFVDGYKFYLSTNGVWLTDHVSSRYLGEARGPWASRPAGER